VAQTAAFGREQSSLSPKKHVSQQTSSTFLYEFLMAASLAGVIPETGKCLAPFYAADSGKRIISATNFPCNTFP
jgi:hypothetical protein